MSNRNGNELNRILINATQSEEVRVAITNNRFLDNLFIEEIGSHRTGNIYKARVTRVVPSLQAAFVDFGSERHGFLPLKEIAPEYFKNPVSNDNYTILDILSEGQELIVQVEKEERGNKGAALTTFITLAGCYLVLMPNNPSAGGISRRIEGEDRDQLREYINALNLPDNMGLIIRTAGVGRAQEEIEWDLDILLRLWQAIQDVATQRAPFLIHQESDIVIRALRDYLRRDISEIIIDSPALYEKARQHIATIRPEFIDHIKLYQDPAIPLFSRYHIEDQIESAFLREVELPSGGFIVIQETEAMVTVDVNSARDTKAGNIEQTAFNTNREAAVEVARQLRLRDLGGLIAIDFIDMVSNENQQKVVEVFKEETRSDKARVQFNRISRFGILEVSRQRLRPSLTESSQIVCPRCAGRGSIRSVESLGLLLLRLIRQEALHDNVIAVNVHVPIEVAAFLVNEKRLALTEIETYHHTIVRILPNPHIETPQYKLERVYENQSGQQDVLPSYKQLDKTEIQPVPAVRTTSASTRHSEPAVKGITAPNKPRVSRPKEGHRILSRLWQLFSGNVIKPEESKESQTTAPVENERPRRQHNGRPRGRQHQGQSRHPSSQGQSRQATQRDHQREHNPAREGQQRDHQREHHPAREGQQRDHQREHNPAREGQQRDHQREHNPAREGQPRDHQREHNPAREGQPRHQQRHRSGERQERNQTATNRIVEPAVDAATVAPMITPVVIKQEHPPVVVTPPTMTQASVTASGYIPPLVEPVVEINFSALEKEITATSSSEHTENKPAVMVSVSPQLTHSPQRVEQLFEVVATEVIPSSDTLVHETTTPAEHAASGETQEKRRYRHHRNRYRQRGGQRRRQNNTNSSQQNDGDSSSSGNEAPRQPTHSED
jgi:ribonuclease E